MWMLLVWLTLNGDCWRHFAARTKKKKTQTNLHALAGWLIDGFSAFPAPRACFSCSIVWTSTIVICWACGYQCPCVGLKPASQACLCQIFFIPYCNLTYQLLLSYLRNTTLGQIPDSQFPIPDSSSSNFCFLCPLSIGPFFGHFHLLAPLPVPPATCGWALCYPAPRHEASRDSPLTSWILSTHLFFFFFFLLTHQVLLACQNLLSRHSNNYSI